MVQKSIIEQCPSCGGTGLYSGFAEPKGTAVICLNCGGQGWYEYSYTPFEGRKKKRGIKTISKSRGAFVGTGVGATGTSMTYAEFERKVPVKKPRRQ